MLHALVIGSVLALLVSEQMWSGRQLPLGAGATIALTAAALALVWLSAHAATLVAVRRLDRGRPRWAHVADWILAIGRIGVGWVQIGALLGLGLLPAVRTALGDWPLALDELVALAPLWAGLVLMAYSSYPLERRLREAALLRRIDEGADIGRLPGPLRHTIGIVRNQMALLLVPLLCLLMWHDTLMWIERRFAGEWLTERLGSARAAPALMAIELTGAAIIFLLMPALMRRIWETAPLGPGPLRHDLLAMCRRHRAPVRDILVWRTDGAMVNAAVMGLAPPLRYILITDGLLERMERQQVEAVMAHELAHIRRRHLPWLIVSVVASLLAIGLALAPLEAPLARLGAAQAPIEGAILLLGTGLILGLVSRRFEWQADAFAAADLSIAVPHDDPAPRAAAPPVITEQAAGAMAAALRIVAALNHVAPGRFSFRHGSIASRRRRLARLIGHPIDRLPIDRQVRWIKLLSLLGLAISAGAWFLLP